MVEPEVGVKFDQDKPMMYLLNPKFVLDVAKVLTLGAKKYAPDNWKKVSEPYQRYISALERHMFAYHGGEKLDPESGISHLCHVVCCAMFLYGFDEMFKEVDVNE
jgi:hypothetical protein